MRFVDNTSQMYPHSIPVFPAIDPAGSNEKLFLMDHHGESLVHTFESRDYSIAMAPVRVGQEFNLMSNSNMNLMIMSGKINVADILSRDFYIAKVFIEIMGELFAIDVSDELHAKGVSALEGDTRGVNVRLGKTINVNREVRTYFGDKPYWLPLLEAEDHRNFDIEFCLNGRLDTNRGNAMFAGDIHEVVMGDAPNLQSKFAKALKASTKVVAFSFKASIA